MATVDLRLKIMSLNCWGIPVVSKYRLQRMNAISAFLERCPYDVISLQEVWVQSDYMSIKNNVKNTLPYSHYFNSGVFGSGVCIFSKYPLTEVYYHQWPVNGYMHKLHHGDWFGGKGVGLCRLQVNGIKINIYCTHLHAEYNRDNDEYKAHRIIQAFDTAQFIRLTNCNADLTLLAGDLNSEPEDLAYRILIQAAGLSDSFVNAKEKDINISGTNQCYYNTFSMTENIKKQSIGVRIDYVMHKCAHGYKVVVQNYSHPLPIRVQGEEFSYSDHEGICSTIELHSGDSTEDRNDNYKSVLDESITICNNALKNLNYQKRFYLFWSVCILFILLFTVDISAPSGLITLYFIVRLVLAGVFFFMLIMGTFWNRMETNGILAGQLAMIIDKQNLQTKKQVNIL